MFILFILFIGESAFCVDQELLDWVNECNRMACHSATNGDTNSTGLQIVPKEVPAVRPQRSQRFVPQPVPESYNDPTLRSSQSIQPQQSAVPPASQNSPASGQQRAASLPMGGGGVNNGNFGHGMPITGTTAGRNSFKPNLQNGLLYRDDDEDSSKKTEEPQALLLSNQASNSGTSVQEDLQKKAGEAKGKGAVSANQALFPGAGSSSAPFGQFQSSGGGAKAAKFNDEDNGSSLLKNIAGRLGLDRFFGTSGKSGTRKSRANRVTASRSGSVNISDQPLKDPKAILQAQLDRQLGRVGQSRGTASALEFGSSQSFLFHSMCQHYKRYAHRARIPYPKNKPCPQN